MNIFQKVKAFFKVKSFVKQSITEAKKMNGTKPGWKTTEFWLQIAAQTGTIWAAVQGFIPEKYAAVISIAGVAVYTVARTIVKAVNDIKVVKTA